MENKEKLELYFKAKTTYYEGLPIMSDAEFDILENELRDAGLLTEENEQVGYQSLNAKIKHWNPMLSLDKIQVNDESEDEFKKILKKCKEFGKVNIWWKLDGCSISCQLKLANPPELGVTGSEIIEILTRGDGSQGISVKQKLSSHLLSIINELINNQIITKTGEYELRGECIMKKNIFAEKYSSKYANERNFVAGILNRDYNESDIDIYNDIDIIIYDIIDKNGNFLDMKSQIYDIKNIKDVQTIFNEFHRQRKEFYYLTDGLVMKVADVKRRKELGNDKRYPKWAIAIKFPSEIATTEVMDFEYTITKNGEINVVALLKPVELDGTIVKRVNCANPQLMIEKGINKGAIVRIKKSGDIIPMIIDVSKRSELDEKCYPDNCPICNSKLNDSDLQHVKCSNLNCDGSAYEKFKSGVEIFGLEYLGEALIKKLYNRGMRQGYEIFNAIIEEYLDETHKNYQKVQQQILETKEIELWKLIYSLQIKDNGRTISKELAKLYAEIEYSEYGLQRSVFIDFKENYIEKLTEIINKLKEKNIEVKMPTKEIKKENVVYYEMTGKTTDAGYKTKSDFQEYLHFKHPNYVHASISKDSGSEFILFTNDKSSTTGKMAKAIKQGITVKTYDEV